jgi:hypothetical protein
MSSTRHLNHIPTGTALITELHIKAVQQKSYISRAGLPVRNEEIANIVQQTYTAEELNNLEQLLESKETLYIPVIGGYSVEIDGTPQPVAIVAATEIDETKPNHGDMSSMLYLRDHIQTASVFMELYLNSPEQYKEEGKQGKLFLMSALHLMSTPMQLKRFSNIIKKGAASQEDWPHISLLFNDMEGQKPNGWRNKQDTFQMLAYLTCDALEHGYIQATALSKSHKEFLGSVAPLLKTVGFPAYENSGSWEEVAANRTSVMAVETALLHKIETLTKNNQELSFLRGDLSLKDISSMRDDGLRELGRRLPFESPDYPKNSIKYREADAALVYVLMYGIPKLLADAQVPTGPHLNVMSEPAIEALVLEQLSTLIDSETKGMRRYSGDSYQRVNFHTNQMQAVIRNIKQTVQQEAGDGEIDLDKKQFLRDKLMPAGKEAAWTHPLGQLSAWAAKRSIVAFKAGLPADAKRYRTISTQFLNYMLSTVTGEDSWNAVLDSEKQYVIHRVPAAKLPECYVTYQTPEGDTFVVPSPHTPLNWSTATLKEAVGLLRIATVLQ